jgi:protein dithiol:quinone oxidoreductase
MPPLTSLLQAHPRRALAGLAAVCVAMLAFGLYLQHLQGLDPCPMCIVQRYALVGVGLAAALAASGRQGWAHRLGAWAVLGLSGLGAFTAARQSWLQWFPPEVMSCGRDLYGMIERFPLRQVVPMVFRGTGDCAKIDWTFLGLSIANWSFVVFVAMGALAVGLIRALRRP